MNPIKQGREAIGWDVARLAANACVDVDTITSIETADFNEVGSLNRLLVNILEQRGARFKRDADGRIKSVVSPLSHEELRKIVMGTGAARIFFGISTSMFGDILDVDMTSIIGLRNHGLVELSPVYETVDFEGDKLTRPTGNHRIRLSRKGRAYRDMVGA